MDALQRPPQQPVPVFSSLDMSSPTLDLTPKGSTKKPSVIFSECKELAPEPGSRSNRKSKQKDGKQKFLGKMGKLTGWLGTSEPSVQALKQHKKATFAKAGVSFDDPRACAKLHIPLGKIPADAIKPAGRGPDPEDVVKKKVEAAKARHSYTASTASRSSRSSSSGFSENSSVKPQSYRDHFPFD